MCKSTCHKQFCRTSSSVTWANPLVPRFGYTTVLITLGLISLAKTPWKNLGLISLAKTPWKNCEAGFLVVDLFLVQTTMIPVHCNTVP